MQQLPLDFSATGNSHRESSPTIDSTGTQSWTQKSALAILGTPSGYHFEEHVTIGGTRYEFRISNKIREWAYQLDEENNHIKSIFFLLKTWEKTYKFEIGFDNYARSERDNSRYQDDTVLEYIMHLRIIYIHKLDTMNEVQGLLIKMEWISSILIILNICFMHETSIMLLCPQ